MGKVWLIGALPELRLLYGRPMTYSGPAAKQRIMAESRAIDHGPHETPNVCVCMGYSPSHNHSKSFKHRSFQVSKSSFLCKRVKPKMMQDFRLASVLGLPFWGERIPPSDCY